MWVFEVFGREIVLRSSYIRLYYIGKYNDERSESPVYQAAILNLSA